MNSTGGLVCAATALVAPWVPVTEGKAQWQVVRRVDTWVSATVDYTGQ